MAAAGDQTADAKALSTIWYMLGDPELFVYHYTKGATVTDHIFPTGKLRFSSFEHLNDPYEYQRFILNYASSVPGVLDGDFSDFEKVLFRRLKQRWRIGCFVSDIPEACATRQRELELGYLNPLEALYERGHSRPRMWAQYAENHRGVCLVFLKDQIDSAIRRAAAEKGLKVFAGRVAYENSQLSSLSHPEPFTISMDAVARLGADRAIDQHIELWSSRLFLTKARDWEAEREYRWLLAGEVTTDVLIDIRTALIGILVGNRAPAALKRTIGKYALGTPIQVAEMDWRNGIPQISPGHPRLMAQTQG